MIQSIGVDIVEIARIRTSLQKFGERFAQRILTETELDSFRQRNDSAVFLASRFAAKEAASKALGTGIADGVTFHSLEVVNNVRGKPSLLFHDRALEIYSDNRLVNCHLSLSDERRYCVAMVVLESS